MNEFAPGRDSIAPPGLFFASVRCPGTARARLRRTAPCRAKYNRPSGADTWRASGALAADVVGAVVGGHVAEEAGDAPAGFFLGDDVELDASLMYSPQVE